MPTNIEVLGATLNNRMKQVSSAAVGVTLELGKITANGGLKLDSFAQTIPKGDYMVSLNLTLGSSGSVYDRTNTALVGDERAHVHGLTVPGALRGPSTGDRVLVAWVGTEPIVVSVVVGS